jgi:hypothetical protein
LIYSWPQFTEGRQNSIGPTLLIAAGGLLSRQPARRPGIATQRYVIFSEQFFPYATLNGNV